MITEDSNDPRDMTTKAVHPKPGDTMGAVGVASLPLIRKLDSIQALKRLMVAAASKREREREHRIRRLYQDIRRVADLLHREDEQEIDLILPRLDQAEPGELLEACRMFAESEGIEVPVECVSS